MIDAIQVHLESARWHLQRLWDTDLIPDGPNGQLIQAALMILESIGTTEMEARGFSEDDAYGVDETPAEATETAAAAPTGLLAQAAASAPPMAAVTANDFAVPSLGRGRYTDGREGVPEEHRDLYDAELLERQEEAARVVSMPPPAFSAGTCMTCGMSECHHDTACPFCGAEAAEPCVTASGFQTSKPHIDRRKATQAKAIEAHKQKEYASGARCRKCDMLTPCHHEYACETCGAKKGKGCVSIRGQAPGTVQQKPHAPRRHAAGAA